MLVPRFVRRSTLALVVLLASLGSVEAEVLPGEGPRPDAAKRMRKVSAYYETIVTRSLQKFYDSRSFIVNAKVLLNEMIVPLEYSRVEERLRGVERLPGLPVVPEALRGDSLDPAAGDSMQVRKFRKEFGVRYVDINVLVDTSYNVDDFEFIVELVNMAADLDEYRGDRVNIRKKVFPRTDRGIDSPLKNFGKRVDAEPVLPVALPLVAPTPEKENPWKPYYDDLPSLFPLLLLLLFVLLIVMIVVRTLRPPVAAKKDEDPAFTALITKLDELKAASSVPSASEDEDEQDLEFKSLRTYALNRFIGDPSSSSAVLRNWISITRDKGLKNSSLLIAGIDHKLLDLVSAELDPADVRAIDLHLRTGETPEQEKFLPVFRDFRRQLEESATSVGDSGDIFNFVRQLSSNQVMHLLKGESEGIIGMVMAQLHPDQAAELVRKLEPAQQAKVLVNMGKLDNIPVSLYKEVAERLSRKALEISSMKHVAANGLDAVLGVIDSLSIDEQASYVNSIAEQDLALGEKLRQSFVAFEEIPGLSEDFLQKVLPEVDTEVLAASLVGAPPEMSEKVLAFFPERMQQMLKSGLDSKADMPKDEIESARKQLLQVVRQELKKAGGR